MMMHMHDGLGMLIVAMVAWWSINCSDMAQPMPSTTPQAPASRLTLVESWPLETALDDPEVPDAPNIWLEMIDRAQHSIDFLQFYAITESDSRLEKVIQALESRSESGVKVRFVLGERFREMSSPLADRLAAHPHIEVHWCDYPEHLGGVLHIKSLIVDDEEVFIGSQNFDWRALEHIVELGIWTDAPNVVKGMVNIFAMDLAMAKGQPCDELSKESATANAVLGPAAVTYGDERVQVQLSASPEDGLPAGVAWDLPLILEMIASAQTRVRVQLLSYHIEDYDGSEFLELDSALKAAADRGVQVQLMVAHWSKGGRAMEDLKALQTHANIEVQIVTIPPHSSGFIPFARVIHAKFMVVDGNSAWVGTSNWSGDYFYHSRNAGVVVHGEPFAADLNRLFERLWNGEYAETVDPEKEYEAPRYLE